MEHLRFDSTRIEQLVGGKALNLAGLLLVFLGTGFFFKVAFDHNWIAPAQRIELGLLVGAGLIVYAQLLAKRNARYFSDGITALGASVLFLSLYAGGSIFHLIPSGGVFAGMIVTSAALAALGWRHRSERLGVLAAVAGFLSPLLIGAPQSNDWLLAGYLAVLAASLLLLGDLLESKILAPLALAGTLVYGVQHFYLDASIAPLAKAEIFATLYAVFAVATWIANRLRGRLDIARIAIAVIAFAAFGLAMYGTLGNVDRTLLGAILFALAAAHVGAAVALRTKYQTWMGAAALTAAMPAMFAYGTSALAIGWSAEAVALICAGVFAKDDVLRIGGYAMIGLCILLDLGTDVAVRATMPLWNERFVSLFALVAALVASNAALALKPFRSEADGVISDVLRIVSHIVALWMLTAEAWDFSTTSAVSILWTVFASGLIAAGLRKRDAMLRWEGLALIAAAIAKVLIYDLGSVDIAYRVLSGIGVGAVLIVISYVYQRRTISGTQA